MRSIPDDLVGLLPREVARAYNVVPLSLVNDTLEIASPVPLSDAVLDDLRFITGRAISPVLAGDDTVSQLLHLHYASAETGLAAFAGASSAVELVHRLIEKAITAGASDIHVEPYEAMLRVRYRLDGVLHPSGELPLRLKDEIIARIKILAGLDIAEKRRPQDGRIRVPHQGRTIDLRVSTLPTDFGEKVALRILDKHGLQLDLATLGLEADDRALLEQTIRLPYGMILVTGPTGSGKTTTLYAALSEISSPRINVTTIEDPIEYNLPGINQTHVRSDIGFTFAHALRAFLRQDPNVIMVGEIRDVETAEIAVRAALTGHLVLSTLHTNDAASTMTRLVDMGIEPFLVASAVRLVVAQRLVRLICAHCKDIDAHPEATAADGTIYRGRGCPRCNGTGYAGRTAVFEVMPLDEAMIDLVARKGTTQELRMHARRAGMRTLREAALEKMRAGLTTMDEILRETTA